MRGHKNTVKLINNNSSNHNHVEGSTDGPSSQAVGVARAEIVAPIFSVTTPSSNIVTMFPTVVLHPTTPVPAVPRHIRETLTRASTVIKKLPPLLPKPQVQHRTGQLSTSITSCYNCQKLSRVLPYMAHSRRKVAMASRKVVKAPMLLLCEVCGCSISETSIFGDHMQLGVVSRTHLPFMLSNTARGGPGLQNYINHGQLVG